LPGRPPSGMNVLGKAEKNEEAAILAQPDALLLFWY
jgi:hypothetical protein